jgi:predicted Zn-dependent protease
VLDPLRQAVDAWLRLRPGRADQVQGRVWKARVARLAVDHPAASAALQEAVKLDPDHFEARFHLALSLLESRPDEAREHLERLVAREPGNEFLRYGLANTYRTLGRTQDARRLLEGLRSGPTELSALLQLAGIDMDEGKLADAEPRIRRVLAQAPTSPEASAAMSRFLQLSGRPAEAEVYRKRFDELDAERLKKSAPKQ